MLWPISVGKTPSVCDTTLKATRGDLRILTLEEKKMTELQQSNKKETFVSLII